MRERLLDAATELAIAQGFDACGLREIAARAEVSPAMVAYYFGDRQGLYEAMFQRIFDRITEQARAVFTNLAPTAEAGREGEAPSDGRESGRVRDRIELHVQTRLDTLSPGLQLLG